MVDSAFLIGNRELGYQFSMNLLQMRRLVFVRIRYSRDRHGYALQGIIGARFCQSEHGPYVVGGGVAGRERGQIQRVSIVFKIDV